MVGFHRCQPHATVSIFSASRVRDGVALLVEAEAEPTHHETGGRRLQEVEKKEEERSEGGQSTTSTTRWRAPPGEEGMRATAAAHEAPGGGCRHTATTQPKTQRPSSVDASRHGAKKLINSTVGLSSAFQHANQVEALFASEAALVLLAKTMKRASAFV